MSNPLVLIDTRKGRQDRRWSYDLSKLPPLNEYGIECVLDSGDVVITGNGPEGTVTTGIEVKSLSSLVSALSSGHIQTQLTRMTRTYTYSWLLYYGIYRPGDDDKRTIQVNRNKQWVDLTIGSRTFPYGYLQNALLELSLIGVNSLPFTTVNHIAEWVGCVARWWNKPWKDHSLFRTLDKTGQTDFDSPKVALLPNLDTGTKLRMKVASAFDGMGYERSLAAAQHFQTVRDMVNADRSQWLEVNGIGEVLAASIEQSCTRRS